MSVSTGTNPAGRVVTFYSYKGGTGRTMALANVAWLLASNGYKVLTIDWDLESPGLHRYFNPFLTDKKLRNSEGIIDLIRRYADAMVGAEPAGAPDLKTMAQIHEYAASLDWPFPRGGLLDFVPAGRQDLGYAAAVSTFDWDAFWYRQNGNDLLEALRQDMIRNYDFVLIDSRTGSSDTGGICTVQFPEIVVNCFTLNTQSIDGAVAITGSIRAQAPEITVYPVPTRIEYGEKAKLERGRVYSRRNFEPYLPLLSDRSSDAYWNSVEVPYIPYYAYEETLAVFGDVPQQNGPLLAPYVRLTTLIAGHDCPAATIPEADRLRVLREFEQSVPRDRRKIVVTYAPLDRIWAEWLRERLSSPQHEVVLHSIRDALPDLDAVDDLVVVFSRDLVAREEGLRLLRTARDRTAAGTHRRTAVLRVDATPMERRVPSQVLVDVMGAAEERVLELVHTTLTLEPVVKSAAGPVAPAVRYPSDLPPHFQVSLARNPRFSGRAGVLEDIRGRLLSSGPHGGRLALTGLPGVGKTQTALEYVYRFAASYDGVWWISATQPGQVRIALADIATKLELSTGNVEEQVAAALEMFRKAVPVRRWLVVLDNVDMPADIAGLIPAGPGHIMVTSRNPQWGDDLDAVDVGVFQRGESIELLARRVPNVAVADADRLAGRLGDLPLALEQAAGWLGSTAMAVPDYLDLLDLSAVAAMDENAPPDYSETIASTVAVAYDELSRRSPAAARLIELLAFMAPEVIPYRMISNKQLSALLAPVDARMRDPGRHGSLIRDLGRFGLARVDAGTTQEIADRDPNKRGVVVHRLTQDIVRSRLTPAEQAERRQEIQSVLAEAERGNPDSPGNRAAYEALRPHLSSSGALASDRPEGRQLIIDMARYLWIRGDYAACQQLAEAALKEWLPRSGPDDTWVLRLRHTLALARRDQGFEAEAYAMNEDSLARLRRTLGDDDPYTLNTASSFGADLRARGEYEAALHLDEQTVAGYRNAYGDDHFETISAINNLAVSLRFVGDFKEAARHDRDALQARRSLLGNNALATHASGENLGTDLLELGTLIPARDRLAEAYEALRRNWGEHLRTLRTAATYSVALRRVNQLDRAAEVIDDAVRLAETTLGREHRVTLSCRLEQADVRWAEGKIKEARAAGEDVYADFQRLRGDRHPETVAAGNDLAIFRRLTGDTEGALQLAEQTFERLEARFNPAHPYTLAGMITLANAQYETGSHHLAAETDAGVLKRVRKALTDDHPTRLAAISNWAVSHRDSEPGAAARERDAALQGMSAKLGPTHPSTVAAREWRRIDQDIAPFPT